MIQLKLFNGGLNTRLKKHLIGTNEATICNNVNLFGGSLSPLYNDNDLGIAVEKSLYYFNEQWLSSTEDIDYQEFKSRLYYSDGVNRPKKTYDAITWYNLGIEKPSTDTTVASGGTGVISGTYYYTYTYYNINDGAESQPATYSPEIVLSSESANIDVVASTDAQVTHIRIFRLGGDLAAMTLVAEVSNTTQTYNDNAADIDIAGNTLLSSYDSKEAPTGLKYLTESNSMFFGAIGDKLWFSDIAFVDAWSAFNFIDFDEDITGIGPSQNGMLVFTRNKTYIITGNSPSSLSKFLLDKNQGCLLHKSIQYINNEVIWLSNDGLCTSIGGNVRVISRDKLGKYTMGTAKCSAVLDDVYYISYNLGTLVADFREALKFSTLDITPVSFHVQGDNLHYSLDSKLYQFGTAGAFKEMSYKTGFLTTEYSYYKLHDNLRISYQGTFDLVIYTESAGYSFDLHSPGRTVEEIIGFNGTIADGVEFYLVGNGTIFEISYDTYDRESIMTIPKFFDTLEFKASVLVNQQPTLFNHIASNSYRSDIIPLDITNNKLFGFLYFTFIGTLTVKVFIDSIEVKEYSLSSETLKTIEHKLPSTVKRGYNIRFQYLLVDNAKLYAIETPIERRHSGR